MALRPLPTDISLQVLEHQAKALHLSVSNQDPATLSRIKPFFANPDSINLSDAQQQIARDYGFSSWRKMKSHIENVNMPSEISSDQLANEFLRLVALVYSETDHADPERFLQAQQLLTQHPTIRNENIFTAAAIGDVEKIQQWLQESPEIINQKGGYHNWEPLMYAAYARLPDTSTLEAGRILIDHGADPNSFYLWGGQYIFTVLTGVFGQGEAGVERLPEHPEYEKFARLLLEAGANPNDSQAAYNRIFTPDNSCLKLLLEYGLSAKEKNNWQLFENDKLIPSPETTLNFQLNYAVDNGLLNRVQLLVDHGSDINHVIDGKSPYQKALLNDHQEIADLLLQHGAEPLPLDKLDQLRIALLSGKDTTVARLLQTYPQLDERLREKDPGLLEHAVNLNNPAALARLLEIGFDVNYISGRSALHQAAWHGNIKLIDQLMDAGADSTCRDHSYFATPIGWAMHNNKPEAAVHLERFPMDIFMAVVRGNTDAINHLLISDPTLKEVTFREIRPCPDKHCEADWMTPLAIAVSAGKEESVRCLLSHRAATMVNNTHGLSIIDMAMRNKQETIIDMLHSSQQANRD